LINAAGLFADKISKMAGARNFVIKPRKGEYFLLDNNVGNLCKHTIFQTPDAFGKGVLVTPTVDGNILVGPSAEDTQDKTDTSTSRPFQDLIMDKAEKSIPNIPRRNIINSFAGVRAIPYDEETGKKISDFIIEEDSKQKGFINVAGICSPGLTAAPAIGKYVAELLKNSGLKLSENKDFIPIRKGIDNFFTATPEKQQQLIEENPLYGRIICRCEMITEAEIVKAIHSTIGAKDLDGIKHIILLTDGGENCDESPCDYSIELMKKRRDIKIDVVAFNVNDDEDLAQLRCVADVTSAKFIKADTNAELINSMERLILPHKQVEALLFGIDK
jgi:glycerol-3-phosphate dehydrogenase